MRFAAGPAARVTVTLETCSCSCAREHRELVPRGGFAPEYKDNRAHPFKPHSGLSWLDAAREVGRGVANDLARPGDRDATVASFDPGVEWTGRDRAFAPDADDESRFLHSTDDGVWDVARMQVDCTRGGRRTCLGRVRSHIRLHGGRHTGPRSTARTSAAANGTNTGYCHRSEQPLSAPENHEAGIGSAVGFLEASR